MRVFTFIQKTSSKSKSSVLIDCSELDSEIILSECRIVGALEGTRLELGVRLQLYTYWYNTGPAQAVRLVRFWPDQYSAEKGACPCSTYIRVSVSVKIVTANVAVSTLVKFT